MHLADVPYTNETCPIETIDIKTRQRLFNYTFEDIQEVITPMAQNKKEALSILESKLYQLQQIANENQKREFLAGLGSSENGWGKQIRSYVLHPYVMCKDHRTNFEIKNNEVEDLLNKGESLTSFIEAFLELKKNSKAD